MTCEVWVTGVGVVSALGPGTAALLRAPRAIDDGDRAALAQCAPSAPPARSVDLERNGADQLAAIGEGRLHQLDRGSQLALLACSQAAASERAAASEQATATAWMQGEHGVVLGYAGSHGTTAELLRTSYTARRPHRVSPLDFPATSPNAAAAQAAIWHGWRGVNATLCAGELSGLSALHYAVRALARRQAASVIAGGAEELSTFATHARVTAAAVRGQQLPCLGEGVGVFRLRLASAALKAGHRATLRGVRLFRGGRAAGRRLSQQLHQFLEVHQVPADKVRWCIAHLAHGTLSDGALKAAFASSGLAPSPCLPAAMAAIDQLGAGAAAIPFKLAAAVHGAPVGSGVLVAADSAGHFGLALLDIPPTATRTRERSDAC